MSIADDIISCRMPDLDLYLREGNSLDDIDEYGFTPLIESAITCQSHIAEALLLKGAHVNKPDVTGRTPLHWAVDNEDLKMTKLLLEHGANANAYDRSGLSVLVYPVLRGQDALKHLLYQHGAKLDFAQDFILGKLLGHRFELQGDIDIVTAESEFIELDFEGFILEFTVAVLKESLRRYTSSYSTRHMRRHFSFLHEIMDGFEVAAQLLQYQQHIHLNEQALADIKQLIKAPLLILPAASRGHAMCFVRYHQWWAKIDRGENSLKEGSVNIYRVTRPETLDLNFVREFLYKKQGRRFYHEVINQQLGLMPVAQLPISSQITGNCSWANIQAAVPVAYAMLQMTAEGGFQAEEALNVYENWVEWDKDRALDECIHRFYLAGKLRKASLASMLGALLFQACDHENSHHILWAEKILTILTLPEYAYILQTYLSVYCVQKLSRKGNNLLKILDDCGVNPNIDVNPIATGL